LPISQLPESIMATRIGKLLEVVAEILT
jgi:hypothetical protein